MATRAIGQRRANPIVGFMSYTSQGDSQYLIDALRSGLRKVGFVEKQNVSIEYRFAEGSRKRVMLLARELVERNVDVLVAGGTQAAEEAKLATAAIPVVFVIGDDPIRLNLVDTLAHPRGNVTGVAFLALNAKRLEMFHLLAPKVKVVAYLTDSNDLQTSRLQLMDTQDAARALGIRLVLFKANSDAEIEAAFAAMAQQGLRALHVGGSGLFLAKRDRILSLAMQHSILTTYGNSETARAGALMTYAASITDAYREAGLYVARILKGAKPAELPVLQSSKPELIINLKTAKALGVTIPQSLLQRADQVIE